MKILPRDANGSRQDVTLGNQYAAAETMSRGATMNQNSSSPWDIRWRCDVSPRYPRLTDVIVAQWRKAKLCPKFVRFLQGSYRVPIDGTGINIGVGDGHGTRDYT